MELSKAERMMLGIAIGDALGREYENIPRKEITIEKVPEGYAKGTGIYTDDTQMSIAVAEAMISGKPFEAETLALKFTEAYRRDRREGYSRETLSMLENSSTGEEFIASMTRKEKAARRSDGAAMRAVPIGLFPGTGDVIRNAIINSEISHAHQHAISASVAIALASHYFYYDRGPRKNIIEYIMLHMEHKWPNICSYLKTVNELEGFDHETILGEYADYGPPYTDAKPVLGAVLFIIKMHSDNPLEAIQETLSLGGDADTTLSMVLGIIMTDHPAGTLPEKLVRDLENGKFGRDYLLKLGKELDRRFPAGVN
ncbi:ADP-ribosylglycohydrolase family protein [Methanolacinia petrolearia]|nr:ADP-ribosylglycohydrolase family protein [Methanolacinia petrolearia]